MAAIKKSDPCYGCVCATCSLCEKQGNMHGCRPRSCRDCTDKNLVKRAYCSNCKPVEQPATDDLRL